MACTHTDNTEQSRQHRIGLEAEAYSQKAEQEGIDARRFFDPSPIDLSTQWAFTLCDLMAGSYSKCAPH